MQMVVTYDIANPKRLNKIAKIIKDYGVRVQKSKFEVRVNFKVFTQMKKRVEHTIDPEFDGVKYIPLCERCIQTLEIIGQGVCIEPDEEYLVL